MAGARLFVERWLPVAEISVESTRGRTPMTSFPAPTGCTSGERGVRWRRRERRCRSPLPRETRTDDVKWKEGGTSCGFVAGAAGWLTPG